LYFFVPLCTAESRSSTTNLVVYKLTGHITQNKLCMGGCTHVPSVPEDPPELPVVPLDPPGLVPPVPVDPPELPVIPPVPPEVVPPVVPEVPLPVVPSGLVPLPVVPDVPPVVGLVLPVVPEDPPMPVLPVPVGFKVLSDPPSLPAAFPLSAPCKSFLVDGLPVDMLQVSKA
jgi:hypothetical protein